MSTAPTLTFAQLKEDLAALPAYSPHLPTNVIAFHMEAGQVLAEFDDSTEEDLRKELEEATSALEDAEKAKSEADDARDVVEKENATLLAEMHAIHEGEESIKTYRERTLQAEKQMEEWREYVRQARGQVEESERECKALRSRKGIPAGVFAQVHEIRQLLSTVARTMGHNQQAQAAAILQKIQP